jgi:hypothetical protein
MATALRKRRTDYDFALSAVSPVSPEDDRYSVAGPQIVDRVSKALLLALAGGDSSSLYPIDHKARHFVEKFPKDLPGRCRQRSFLKCIVHQPHPPITGGFVDGKGRMPRAEAWMASLFDVGLWPSKPADQEVAEALLGTWKIPHRIHRS